MVPLIEYLWNQKNRYEGIKEYHELVKEVCTNNGVTLLGLFKPISEPWNWAYFFEADNMGSWQTVIDEIEEKNFHNRGNITQNITRLYTRQAYNPKPKNLGPMRFLNVELDVWEGINVGIKEYFDAHVNMYQDVEGIWFMGQYAVWNEPYNWAHFYWYDNHKNWKHAMDLCFGAMGRPDRITTLLGRTYELYNSL